MINLNTKEIYKSISEAYKITKINNISGCINGRPKTAGGFKWSYFDKDLYILISERFSSIPQ